MIAQGASLRTPVVRRTHTLVIGSGAGGAVVAHALATAGVETVVVEEGGFFLGRDMTQRDDEMLPALYRDAGQQLTRDGLINVLQGSCYGGSTVINAADCEPTPASVYDHWRLRHGLALDPGEIAESQARVFAMLGVRPIEAGQINRNNALPMQGARALGWRTGTFLHNREGCVGSGYCMIGCAYDAKKGAHLNYLPRAVEAGADVYTDVRIERIVPRSGGGFLASGFVVARGPRTPRLSVRSAGGARRARGRRRAFAGDPRRIRARARSARAGPQRLVAAAAAGGSALPRQTSTWWRGAASRSRPTATSSTPIPLSKASAASASSRSRSASHSSRATSAASAPTTRR